LKPPRHFGTFDRHLMTYELLFKNRSSVQQNLLPGSADSLDGARMVVKVWWLVLLEYYPVITNVK
jgi:hypothetical protein